MRQKQSVLNSTSDRRAGNVQVFSGDANPVVTPLLPHGSFSLLSWSLNPGDMRDRNTSLGISSAPWGREVT